MMGVIGFLDKVVNIILLRPIATPTSYSSFRS
jgi:hypothetical protein